MRRPDFAPTLLLHVPLPHELRIKKPANIFAFSPDDKTLLTVHEDEGGVLWDLTMNVAPREFDFKDRACSTQPIKSAVILGPKGDFILAFGAGHPSQHYEIIDESPGFMLCGHTLPAANDVKISEDGRTIVFCTATALELWDGTSLIQRRILSPKVPPRSPFEKVAISDDSKSVAAVDARGQLTVWGTKDDFHKVSLDQQLGLDLEDGWQPTSIGVDHIFASAVLRNTPLPGTLPDWRLVTWGYSYNGPDRTLYHRDFPPCAQACILPSPDYVVALTADGHVQGKDTAMYPWFGTSQGASKRGKVVSCGLSGSSKMLAAARSNGRLTVWRLFSNEVDPSVPLVGY